MLIVKKILGNIYSDISLSKKIEDSKTNGKSQKLFLTRAEMEKIHLRKETDCGLEIGLTFETGTKLHHGDVLNDETSLIVRCSPIGKLSNSLSLTHANALSSACPRY